MSTRFFTHPTAVIDEGCQIGNDVKIWHFSHLMPGCKIGDGCNIGQNVFIASNVVLGKNVKVQNNVSLYEGVICEDDVFIGPSVVFTNVINPRSAVSRKTEYKTTLLKRGATIGANATIVCGNEIGEYAFVGAGSVVTKNIVPYALVMGNPGRQMGWMSEAGEKLQFNNAGIAICTLSNAEYLLKDGFVTKRTSE
jgi:UDP-2-acetamido-3-amino-2,3-dideoxy-glucuronate N-acetyltransferase